MLGSSAFRRCGNALSRKVGALAPGFSPDQNYSANRFYWFPLGAGAAGGAALADFGVLRYPFA